ncbi:hypothetical protein [Leifsonia sp. Leaf264]|uniref:hypothetical protein n=1 Tax=Leifsonia sp. Leaf264 TaxID=1736314 RepID=UPI0006F6BF6C|nr:hypothetical protein [Leifsonia sp. Leaf264]KQO98920.1 hypothetical protein ASF30_12735 [Leifsonia sp. Leaf264]
MYYSNNQRRSSTELEITEVSEINRDLRADWGIEIPDVDLKSICDMHPSIAHNGRVRGFSSDLVRRLVSEALAVKFMGRGFPAREEVAVHSYLRDFETQLIERANNRYATPSVQEAGKAFAWSA